MAYKRIFEASSVQNTWTNRPLVSVIIPTLNEEGYIEKTLKCLLDVRPAPYEILVVDGGSEDATCEIVTKMGIRLIRMDSPSRPAQLNLGAQKAEGEILCFVHADTLVPSDYTAVVRKVLRDKRIAAGGFTPIIQGAEKTRWLTSFHNYFKTYYVPLLFRPYRFVFKGLRLIFGDQTIFCRKKDFEEIGGFNVALPIMEETDFCDRIGNKGKIVQVAQSVSTSDRRIAKWGPLKANLTFLLIGFMWGFGVSAAYLKRFYPHIR